MSQPYCGKCHKWLDGDEDDTKVCNCRNPDLTKDPNCHNSGHDHYDPESPIIKMDARAAEIEDAMDTGQAHVFRQLCEFCGLDADGGKDWPIICPARGITCRSVEEIRDFEDAARSRVLDEGYDAHRINWPRLFERILSSTYNALFYGSLLVLAKALGIL